MQQLNRTIHKEPPPQREKMGENGWVNAEYLNRPTYRFDLEFHQMTVLLLRHLP
eukprot:m.94885 g.94885  ORF g.94885 m.94885 type:complete len:54 (+) comp14743_c0_seq1:737-898(+)